MLEGFPDDSNRFIDMLRFTSDEYRFDVLHIQSEDFPSSATDYDGYIITGSSASANGQEKWLQKLFHLIVDITAAKVPLFGCCFGHQAVAKALGGEVAENPFGWSVGTEITEFTRYESWLPKNKNSISLYSAHQEQVTITPPTARIIGTNLRCPIAAMAIGDSVMTMQYHPEITPAFMDALINSMENEIGNKIEESRNQLKRGSEMELFASCLHKFLIQSGPKHESEESIQIADRYEFASKLSLKAGKLALEYFNDIPSLKIESKGIQDLVSNADKMVEQLIRKEISSAFPEDGIIGEEFPKKSGISGFDWVIDPIDGTSNFVRGIPTWVVSIACVQNTIPVIGMLNDPVHGELYYCRRNFGAFMNGNPISVSAATDLSEGLFGIGSSSQSAVNPSPMLTEAILKEDGMFVRNGSGALDLAFVACGRYIAFMENFMKPWDCLAGILLVEEAGAIIHGMDYDKMLAKGGIVVAAAPGVFHQVRSLSQKIF